MATCPPNSWRSVRVAEIHLCLMGQLLSNFVNFYLMIVSTFVSNGVHSWSQLVLPNSWRSVRGAKIHFCPMVSVFVKIVQRARRTKSRGTNGLQLEVRARRAPRLLVVHILATCPPQQVAVRVAETKNTKIYLWEWLFVLTFLCQYN